jgi:hypothetical protein
MLSRRTFFRRTSQGLAGVAMPVLLADDATAEQPGSVYQAQAPHFRPRARNVIFMFQIGAPSQLDMFDPKPELNKREGDPLPQSFLDRVKFAQIQDKQPRLMGTPYRFSQHGESGQWVSELMPYTARIVDQLSFVHTCQAEDTNHMFGELHMSTGWRRFGRPSIGSWVLYGLGSESENLPGFMVLRSGMHPRSKGANFGNGFLPATMQGTPLQSSGAPILNLETPPGFEGESQASTVETINRLNTLRQTETNDPEIEARISSYELAFRMQSSAPELLDLSSETAETLEMYGIEDPGKPSYARNCLLARRLIERGVRFVELFHGDWDHHTNIYKRLPAECQATDQPSAALVTDLARRGLLDDTLVIWGGEFGRSSVAQKSQAPGEPVGRDHHVDAFTMWFAGGGVAAGRSIGETDDIGFDAITDRWHIHDLHATFLYALGLDHKRLTYQHQGRDYRLTDIHGTVKSELFS